MFESVLIENFRGIERLEVPLSRLTVLVGPNGVGKSSVLDALLFGGLSLGDSLTEAVLRRQGLSDPAGWLLRFGTHEGRVTLRRDATAVTVDLTRPILTRPAIHAKRSRDGRIDESLSVDFGEPVRLGHPARPNKVGVPVHVVDSTARFDARATAIRLTELTKLGFRAGIDVALREVDSRVRGLSIGADSQGQAEPYVDLDSGGVPLALAGDGLRFLVQLFVGLFLATGGTALLEEPETHLHPTAVRALAEAIVARVKAGDQVVLSTHSLELVERLYGRFGGLGPSLEDMSVVRLFRETRRIEGSETPRAELQTRVLRGDRIQFVLDEMGEDLR